MTKNYAHRGSRGKYPENTLLSFEKAIEEGAHGIEIDIHMTKDGEIVVIHDETLNATTNGSGFIKDHNLQDIKALDAGQGNKVPTLEEVYKLLSGSSIELNVEIKTYLINYPDIERKALDIADKFGEGRKIVYSSFHLPTILRMKKLSKSANIAWLLGRNYMLPHPADYMETLELEALHLEKGMILSNPDHFKGIYDKIRVWTVNEIDDMRKLLELGVDAIITDYPDLLADLM